MSIPRGRGLDKLAPHMAGMSIGEHREGRSRGAPIHDESQRRIVDPTRVNFREPGTEKQGTSGELVPLIANYVRVLSAPQWLLYQYHVTFLPDNIDSRKTRRELLAQHKGVLQDVAFDGQTLYSFNDLGDDYETKSHHEATAQDITIQLHKVAVQGPESPNFFHLSNLIMRK
jgi:aubergine-like protein